MPRHRLPQGERRENVTIRLQQKVIDELEKQGKLQEIIEKIVLNYLKKNNN